jgi:hypothetical protein
MVTTTVTHGTGSFVPTSRRAFERCGIAAYLLSVVGLVVAILIWLDGTFVYVLDDAAIHLSVADTLVHHGTWGVSAGSFESASSSPLWTLLVAAGLALAPGAGHWVPLVLNVVAGIVVVMILGRSQVVVRPERGRPLDAAAVVVLVTLVLFLPGLAVVGMEHTLHIALVLGAVVLFDRGASIENDGERFAGWVPYVLLALATLTRFETAFVGIGLVAGLGCEHRITGGQRAARRRQILGVTLGVAVPVAAFAVWNMAMGGGVLPNSVLAKGHGVRDTELQTGGIGPVDVIGRVARDPLLAALVVCAIGYVALTWGRSARRLVPAVTLIVAVLLHAALADVGWFERYQAYLIAIGLYLVLGMIGDLPSDLRRRGLVALMVVSVLFTPAKGALLLKAPRWADEMFRHTYQAGLFFERYYDGEPVATDQLGYISLFHDGPLTDFAGLGDYDVLQRVPRTSEDLRSFWRELAEERGFRVVLVPATSAASAVPDTWVLAGRLRIDGPYGGISRLFDFWATTPDEVTALQDHLRQFESELPDRVTLLMNNWAGLQAAQIRARQAN